MSVLNAIRPGDKVVIVTPHGQDSGRAVMRGPAGWVLNAGGKYGRPIIATEANIVGWTPSKKKYASPFGGRVM